MKINNYQITNNQITYNKNGFYYKLKMVKELHLYLIQKIINLQKKKKVK